jgi:DNA-binding response OmpR family regulator
MEGKILIVEYEESILDVLSECFQDENFEVRALKKVTDIVSTVADFDAEVVIVDYLLTGEDGVELCRKIKKNFPTLPVVIMSAFPKWALPTAGVPCDLFVEKPFDIYDLVTNVKHLKNGNSLTYNSTFA